jgi:solute carrier family 26 (sodium-independent sulfate anion transporter), member 11
VVKAELKNHSAVSTASAVAFMAGIYGLIFGLLKLGFLLDWISAPVLTGFISATAITIILGQVQSLFGMKDIGSGTANQIRNGFRNLPTSQWRDALIGFSGILFLQIFYYSNKRWGKKYTWVRALSIARAAMCLLLYTGISYGVNMHRKNKPLFAISAIVSNSIAHPNPPSMSLVSTVAGRSFAPFLASSLEHIAIGKAFGLKNGYVIDQSQELTLLGITNVFNSFFSAMTVGGAMSRTAVNDSAGVKSPLGGIFTASVIILSIYKISPALYWVPKATLAAIIITAVYHLFGPVHIFWVYWRTSFTDFIACMLAFWLTLFQTAEIGIGAGVGFSILCMLLRSGFATVSQVNINPETEFNGKEEGMELPRDTAVFCFSESILFMNVYRAKDRILDYIMTHYSQHTAAVSLNKDGRSWSVAGKHRIQRLRKRANITDVDALPTLAVVILDFSHVRRLDTTSCRALSEFKQELIIYAGPQAELCLTGLQPAVRKRLERFGAWTLVDVHRTFDEIPEGDKIVEVYPDLRSAAQRLRPVSTADGKTEGAIMHAEA